MSWLASSFRRLGCWQLLDGLIKVTARQISMLDSSNMKLLILIFGELLGKIMGYLAGMGQDSSVV